FESSGGKNRLMRCKLMSIELSGFFKSWETMAISCSLANLALSSSFRAFCSFRNCFFKSTARILFLISIAVSNSQLFHGREWPTISFFQAEKEDLGERRPSTWSVVLSGFPAHETVSITSGLNQKM